MHQTRINVAVVDDDESFARAVGRLLRASGFEVHIYPSAEAYLAPTTLPQPDCLVLDIQLGGMSGLDLQRRLRELGASAPIIFVTAHDAAEVREAAEQGGCSAYFLKPLPGKLLLEAIGTAVSLVRPVEKCRPALPRKPRHRNNEKTIQQHENEREENHQRIRQ